MNGVVGRVVYTDPQVADSDLDLRQDGDELVKIDIGTKNVLRTAFKPLYDKGFRYIYRPFTGLPNRRDTDGDGVVDSPAGVIPGQEAAKGRTERCGSRWTNPLDWDSQGTGLGDSIANCAVTSQTSATDVANRQMNVPIRVRDIDTIRMNLFIKDYSAKWACRPNPSLILVRLTQCAVGNDRDWSSTAGPTDSKATFVFNFRAGRLEYYINETCWENDGGPFGAYSPTCYPPLDQKWLDTKGFDLEKPDAANWIMVYDGADTFSLCYQAKLAGAPLSLGPSINGSVELQFDANEVAVRRNQYPRFEAYQDGLARPLARLDQTKSGLYGLWDSVSEQTFGSFQRPSAC